MADTASPTPNNLPPRPPFVGRREELARLLRLLADPDARVVTLTGPDGAGKTALALEAAYRQLRSGRFSGGVLWADCAEVGQGSLPTLVAVLGCALGLEGHAAVEGYLREESCLIVLDGFDAVRWDDEIMGFLERVPNARTKALVAAREPVALYGLELVIELEPLELPPQWDLLVALWEAEGPEDAAGIVADHGDEIDARWVGLLSALADEASEDGQHDVAHRWADRALWVAQALADERAVADAHFIRGTVFYRDGQAGPAIQAWQRAYRHYEETGARQQAAAALGNMGLVYRNMGDLPQALEHFQQALEIHRQISDRQGEASVLGNMGLVYSAMGELPQALAHHQKALEIAREIGYRQGEASALGNMGLVYSAMGELPQALAHFQQALDIHRQIGDHQGVAQRLYSIGLVHRQQGDLEAALEAWAEAWADPQLPEGLRRDLEEQQFPELVWEMGAERFEAWKASVLRPAEIAQRLQQARECEERGSFERAAALYQQVLERMDTVPSPERAGVSLRLGLALKEALCWRDALDHLNENTFGAFAALGDDAGMARTCMEMARLAYAMQRYEEMWFHLLDAYRLYRRAGDRRGMAAASEELGMIEFFMQSLPEAVRDLEEARNLYQELGMETRAATVGQHLDDARRRLVEREKRQETLEKWQKAAS